MRKAYKFKLFRNKRKFEKLTNDLFLFNQIFNHSLALVKGHYKLFGKNPKKSDLQKHIAKLIRDDRKPEWTSLGYSQGVQQIADRIYLSYDAFFKWAKSNRGGLRKSPPKFKAFRKARSFTLKQAGWKLDEENGKVLIGKKWYRYNNSRNIEGAPKTITVSRDFVGDWFISVSCDLGDDYRPEKIAPVTGNSAGFDFGLKTFLTSSDGEELQSEEFLKTNLKALARANRKLSKKEKGSKNRKKAKKHLARIHRKIANKRRDEHFKMALNLIRKYDYLFFEDLNLQGMVKLWGRKISDLGFSEFIKIIEFKSIEHKKTVHKIDRFFPSSKLCSNCGKIKSKDELTLKDREYNCKCGLKIGRDLNAAINILREGASSLGVGEVSRDLVPAFAV